MIPHMIMNLINHGKAFELIIIDNKENTILRAYPKTLAARKVIKAQARCSIAS